MNNQKTKAGNGSKRTCVGASVFHVSHNIVQKNIIAKKPIVPTLLVIQIANFSGYFNKVL
jgi:hypothetical protein